MTQATPAILRTWAVILVLGALLLGSLAIFTFGAVCFIVLFVLWLQERRRTEESGKETERLRSIAQVNGVLLLLCVIWFFLNIVGDLSRFFAEADRRMVMGALQSVAFLFPPLIMHVHYLECPGGLPGIWRWLVRIYYGVSIPTAMYIGLALLGWAPVPGNYGYLFLATSLVLFALFIGSGLFGALAISRTNKSASAESRQQQRWHYFLLGLMVIAFFLLFVGVWKGAFQFLDFLSVFARSLPLFFLFVNSYYERRFQFFDVFIKKATLFFLALALLIGYFSFMPRLLEAPDLNQIRIYVYALTLLPLVMVLPWAFRRLEEWLDRTWLGRGFSTEEAVKFFLEGVQRATTQEQLRLRSEEQLAQIFNAPVHIRLNPAEGGLEKLEFEVEQEVSVATCGNARGQIEILLGRRGNQTPYFSQDIALLSALAEVLAHMLEYIRLVEKKQQHEKREQELILNARSSELKALRAQINPHFLFNALNAIASLISTDPKRAEETIEQLSEVFRYSLTRSDKEWVRIREEIDFVRSYLEVEKSRFGRKLGFEIEMDDSVADFSIPTMAIQTLVENAVKHGLASMKRAGKIEVRAGTRNQQIEIEVSDNGPGPGGKLLRLGGEKSGSGYGLKNIRDRLRGYFGASASLELTRREEEGSTVARISLPMISFEKQEVRTTDVG